MRPLQILNNKYRIEQQELEYRLEKEINTPYPDVNVIDDLIYQLSINTNKEEYLNQLLINIRNANPSITDGSTDEPNK
jgi:hypothetical protein